MSQTENDIFTETRNRLVDEISSLSHDEFNKRPNSSTWSIAQICHHVALAEESFAKAIVYGLKKEGNNKAERKNIHTMSDRAIKNDAPEIVMPASKPMEYQQIIGKLNDSRNYFLSVLNSVEDPSILAEKSTKHPLFGYLPLDQWVELLYLHEQRHIEQIKDIKSLIGAAN
jgi:hypothetical protein